MNLKYFLDKEEDGVLKTFKEKELELERNIYKVKSKDFKYLFLMNMPKGENILLGFYYQPNNSFYFFDLRAESYGKKVFDFEGIDKVTSLDKHKNLFENTVKNRIREKLNFNENNIPFSHDEKKEIEKYIKQKINLIYSRKEIEKNFLNGIVINKNSLRVNYTMTKFKDSKLSLIYRSILDFDKEVNSECNEYIQMHKKELYYEIVYFRYLQEEIERLSQDKNALRFRKIVNVFSDKSKRSFKIKVLKNNKEYILNVKEPILRSFDHHILSSDIIENKYKKIFFNDNSELKISLDEIVEISYNRKILYNKVNYESL
ncbi:hypothetical protein [Clostridioides difficile]|uniref:hypothetical protein n=1 Tax=Clostridioides difficile TaxID=1496 RepID=UPI0010352FEA|nr:hypothetical protein [Clostridioides difficile]MDM9944120.1 hypothetical protein [Clostridioides difficile]